MPNIEFKAYCTDLAGAQDALQRIGATVSRDHIETDTYYEVPIGRLKLRESTVRDSRLIAYLREDAAEVRTSRFQIAEIDTPDSIIKDILGAALTTRSKVVKRRITYDTGKWLVNLDTLLDRHQFVEVEVPYSSPDAEHAATIRATELKAMLHVTDLDIVPWSYERLTNIATKARYWQDRLGSLKGRLYLIDGASGVGKSSIARALRRDLGNAYRYVPRCTSRSRRADDPCAEEYIYIAYDEFQRQAYEGDFLEYKDFLFQMSYGLRWAEVGAALEDDRTKAVYALVNLGNIRHIREFVPEATSILVTSPENQIRERLTARSVHTEEAIVERLQNAQIARRSAHLYDHVVDNRDGNLEQAITLVQQIIENSL